MSHPQAQSSPTDSSSTNAENHDARLDELLHRLQGLTGKEAPIKAAEPLPPGIKEGEFFPKAPKTFYEARISEPMVEELIFKFLLARGEATIRQISDQVKIPFGMCETIVIRMKSDMWPEYEPSSAQARSRTSRCRCSCNSAFASAVV